MENVKKIIIIGQSNTGKSSLFNVLVRENSSIVYNQKGVTRDIQSKYSYISENQFFCEIVDTGGIGDYRVEDPFFAMIEEKVYSIIAQMDLILFVIDPSSDFKNDLLLIDKLRKYGKKIFFIINKCDLGYLNSRVEDIIYDLKFQDCIQISALHRRNIADLEEKIFQYFQKKDSSINLITKQDLEEKPKKKIYIGIIGKPNVGKSTLLNRFIGKKVSLTSPIAGTTRDTVEAEMIYENFIYTFLDTAGLYRKSKVKNNLEKSIIKRVITAIEKVDIVLFLMDIQEDLSKQDKKILLTCVSRFKQVLFVFTKEDTVKGIRFKNYLLDFYDEFPMAAHIRSVKVSSEKNIGISELLSEIKKLYKKSHRRLPEDKLKAFIQDIHKEYFTHRKAYFKILDIEQKRSMLFILKVVNNDIMSKDYQSYLINKIRKYFSLKGVSIGILFKKKKKNGMLIKNE